MHLVDTHCHIHDTSFTFDKEQVLESAISADVRQLICVGTSGEDSERAVEFVENKSGLWASVGLHPHDARLSEDNFETIARLAGHQKVVAIGECGLDYHYNNSPKADQIQALEYQLQLAQSVNKPCIFHVRDAFSDFWPILDNFSGIRGVVHSFTATKTEVDECLKRGIYVGLNGIMTFTKEVTQLEAVTYMPLENIVLETDSPFLTPSPLRGTINVPANVRLVAACLAEMRGETLNQLIEATTTNAQKLFSLNKSELITS